MTSQNIMQPRVGRIAYGRIGNEFTSSSGDVIINTKGGEILQRIGKIEQPLPGDDLNKR